MVSKYLMQAFFFLFVGIFMQATAAFSDVFLWNYANWPLANIDFVRDFIYQKWDSFQFAYYGLILGIYYLFKFSMEIISKEGKGRGAKLIALAAGLCLIFYGYFIQNLVTAAFPGNMLVDIIGRIDLWVILYALVLMTPILITSVKLRKKIPASDPSRNKLRYISLFALFMLIMVASFIVETFWGDFGIDIGFNPFSFSAWFFSLLALLFSYLGLYKK